MENCSKTYISNDTGCERYFDGLVCWPDTQAGHQAHVDCFIIEAFAQAIKLVVEKNQDSEKGDEPPTPARAYKICNNVTGWTEKANYSECLNLIVNLPQPRNVTSSANKRIIASLNVYLSLLSLGTLLLSLAIFSFKALQCDRLRIHKNFMVSLVFLYIVTVAYFEPYIYESENEKFSPRKIPWYNSNSMICNLMLALLMFCFQAPVFWMFVEGVFLHAKVSRNVFGSTAPWHIYYLIGWVLPMFLTFCWVTGMVMVDGTAKEECWDNYSNSPTIYIIVVPMTLTLLANLLILISIMRVVVTKLHIQTGPLSLQQVQVRKAVRATLILFPLLGLNNLLFFINPKWFQRKELEYIYMLVNSVLKSSQGILLSFLYCFFNSEVQETLKRFFNRFKIQNNPLKSSKRMNDKIHQNGSNSYLYDGPPQTTYISSTLIDLSPTTPSPLRVNRKIETSF